MKLKFAVVGCGRIAQRHTEEIAKIGELVAVCDIDRDKADLLANRFNCNRYYSLQQLLSARLDIDVISICTPNGLHAEHSISALNSGYNVLCEKPMAIKSTDCSEMIKAAEKNNKRLFAIKQNRFNPAIVELKKIIENGILGDLYSVQLNCFWNRNDDYYKNSWKGTKELDGGTLFTQFSHFIDLLYWLIGDIKEVCAFTRNFNHKQSIEFEDTGVVILTFNKDVIGTLNYTVNSYNKNMEGSITIFAQNGTVKVGGQYLNELEYQSIKNYKIENLPQGNTANNYGTYMGSMSNHDKVYENIVDVIQKNASISTSAIEGFKTVEIIEKIYTAAKNH
jgi:UDP-N-acetyl-2-amino-2-deoxyglucuronate dehydrogenase